MAGFARDYDCRSAEYALIQENGSRAVYIAQWNTCSDGVYAYYAWISAPMSLVYGVSCTAFHTALAEEVSEII